MKLSWKLVYVLLIFVDLKLNFRVFILGIYMVYIFEIELLENCFICCRDVVIYVLFIENEGIEKGLDILLEVVMRFVILDE